VPLALIAQAAGDKPNLLVQLAPLLLIFVIFYVVLILPARRRQKAHEAMVRALQPGDKVVTSGGLVGTITRAEEDAFRVRIAPQTEVTVLRSHIAAKAGEEMP